MANNYNIIIKSDKVNQCVASEIFNYISEKCLIHNFKYNGYEISCYIRGYVDLREILTKYGFDETDFTEIIDEFNRAYRYMTTLDANDGPLPEEHPERIKDKKIANEIEAEVTAGNFTIWNVGKKEDKVREAYQKEKETDKSLPKTVQPTCSFCF